MAVPAIIPVLLSGWGASVALYVVGIVQRRTALAGLGILLAGIMTLVTSTLLFLRFLPEITGGYRATAGDILMIGLVGFLGGALAMLGASYITIAARTAAPTRGGLDEGPARIAGKR